MGPILNTILGAGIKLVANLINSWLEQKRQDQMMLASRDSEMMQALIKNQSEQSKDGFVQVTRRILFLSITFTMCYLMIYYAMNPEITYQIIVPRGEHSKWGFLNWITGGKDWEVVTLTGGLLLTSFMDLCFMVVGFYAIPNRGK